jgi:hypothetical protein
MEHLPEIRVERRGNPLTPPTPSLAKRGNALLFFAAGFIILPSFVKEGLREFLHRQYVIFSV